MAKSTRSKVKRHWRAKKREDSVYAVTDAARLHRLSQKLKIITQTDAEGDYEIEDASQNGESAEVGENEMRDSMELDTNAASSKRISTHGPRGSRREEWRTSKGLPPRAKSRGMNRQGLPAAKRKSGRSHRRR
ncbi:hypothetical protein BDY19DRAFT_983331 [Irpex rosettiformis]|uniref:Uncharacterized protein n=1 Tax=Irpex rosettiformis TaxID=378272 RepID=A0ACB8UEJ2_9APHY|nr:hypothetical protein BDY19DRAFT_983331 [Irpex rosettiformis]